MKFYVPEWDDRVDADYDFLHDEHSALSTSDRDSSYIWDIFDHATTPIDGVLISREQVGNEGSAKFERLTDHGVYDDPELDLPGWLPTISDCGAWGYKSLPFPPHGNREMLDFYEAMDVTTGVTIDHLVLGTGHTRRLYLDDRAFPEGFSRSDLPEELRNSVDVMVETWPSRWPTYVRDIEPSIYKSGPTAPFTSSDFEGPVDDVLDRLGDDPRAVYRPDDTQFRYDLTLSNASEMREHFEADDYSFRLMAAIQGWDPDSYVRAARSVLEHGYRYLGIGGVAGSSSDDVKVLVAAIGNELREFQETYSERIDAHVFGFAKTDAFGTIGRSGITSFDSASMLRAAWTGPENYHLDDERRYDALRVRYPQPDDDPKRKLEIALRGQEVLVSLRAFEEGRSIAEALRDWHDDAVTAIEQLPAFLEAHRWDERFNQSLHQDAVRAFRKAYRQAPMLKASFGGPFRRELVRLLRDDSRDAPVLWRDYLELISLARSEFDGRYPTQLERIERSEDSSGEVGTLAQVWPLVESYAEFVGDEQHLDGYEELLEERPWEECSCPICTEYGIEVAIFRGNNRNRRRGFHNTRRFYDQFQAVLPKLLILAVPGAQLPRADTVSSYLKSKHAAFWNEVFDIPVAEIGVMTADGVHEWWEPPPTPMSLDPDETAAALAEHCVRYEALFVHDPVDWVGDDLHAAVEASDCTVHTFIDASELRSAVTDGLKLPAQSQLSSY